MQHLLPEELISSLNPLERAFVLDFIESSNLSEFDTLNVQYLFNQKEDSGNQITLKFHASVLEWCLDKLILKQTKHKIITISNLKIDGDLNLNHYELILPLHFKNCLFSNKIYLNEAETKSLTWEDCSLKDIKARNIIVKGSIGFEKSKVDGGEIDFSGAIISGSMIFSGASMVKPYANILNLDLLNCAGSLVFDKNFRSEGRISIVGAKIGGSIDMYSASLSNINNTGITVSNSVVDGNIFFTGKFRCSGRVGLMNTTVKGNVEIEDGTIQNPQQIAIHADALDCNGSVFIRGGSRIDGEMRFPGASISRVFEIRGSELYNGDRVLFNGQGMHVKGAFEWRKFINPPTGKIQLNTAKVGIYEDDENSWPLKNELEINGFEYTHLGGASPVSFEKRSKWLTLQSSSSFQPQTYETLIRVLKSMGFESEAKKLAISKEDKFAREQLGLFNKFKYFVLKMTMDYGYNPGKIFKRFIIPYLIIGSIVFAYAFKSGNMMPSKDRVYISDEQGVKRPANYPIFNPVVYSIDTFIPLFDLHQQEYWMPKSNSKISRFLFVYLWIHFVSGWLLTSLAVVGYTGLIKKD